MSLLGDMQLMSSLEDFRSSAEACRETPHGTCLTGFQKGDRQEPLSLIVPLQLAFACCRTRPRGQSRLSPQYTAVFLLFTISNSGRYTELSRTKFLELRDERSWLNNKIKQVYEHAEWSCCGHTCL